MSENKSKFELVGIVTSVEFQRCNFYLMRLYKSRPNIYEEPDIRPVLNVEWYEYLTKVRREFGGKLWYLKKCAVVFLNGAYLGDDDDLFRYILERARIRVGVDFYNMGILGLTNMMKEKINSGHKYAYFTIAIAGQHVGSLLFMLYAKTVPRTTKLFLKRCKYERNGWCNTKIHRIVKGSWLQVGGFDLKNKKMACENYIIPHDKRGVLSMCHSAKHTDNSIQFIISLSPTPWMDYKYVAFGQLVQGEEILRKIEAVNTRYQAPKENITITCCGEYKMEIDSDVNDPKIAYYYERVDSEGAPRDVLHSDDVSSDLSEGRYEKGDYCLDSDLKSNLPLQLPTYLSRLYMEYAGMQLFIEAEEGESAVSLAAEPIPITESIKYHESMKKYEQTKLLEEQEHIEPNEIVQKVTEFEVIPPATQPKVTSSERIDNEEIKAMFV